MGKEAVIYADRSGEISEGAVQIPPEAVSYGVGHISEALYI